jgi:hypothetical protein
MPGVPMTLTRVSISFNCSSIFYLKYFTRYLRWWLREGEDEVRVGRAVETRKR